MTSGRRYPDEDSKHATGWPRWRRLLAVLVFVGGCAVTQTIADKMNVKPLSATPFHQQLTAKNQCVHCHTGAAGAPEVPHRQYKNCAGCHTTE